MRKGERWQEKHFRVNAHKLNCHLMVLTRAAEAFLRAKAEGVDAITSVLVNVSEQELAATVTSAKALLRPDDGDSLDLIEARYPPMRQSLLSLYQALDWSPVRAIEPALQALEHVSRLAEHRKRVAAPEQKVGKQKVVAPLGHLSERWRKHALVGEGIILAYYEAAVVDVLKGLVRSGDIAVSGSRRYRGFEGYLLPQPHFDQLVEKQQTRLTVENEAEICQCGAFMIMYSRIECGGT